ncbi:MAG: FtsX-like permease family protein, partial [Acetatifactor sp.]|nr:FtsX-like permease family protein [Acetatifactor sp.]
MCWLCWEVISVTLSKLSLRNAKRQAKDYLVYFVTIVLTVALIYAFNGLVFSEELLALSYLMESLPLMVTLASIVVVCIMGWLVHYTTGFMLSRRSREFGTYILIGLENKQVARLFFLENLAVGSCALATGILLGNLIY